MGIKKIDFVQLMCVQNISATKLH